MESEENNVLGLTWETETDSFVFNLKTLAANALETEMTKRTAKIYDPLGLITAITSPLKVNLQKLFRKNWNDLRKQGRPEALEVRGGGVYGRIYLKQPFLPEHFIFILQHSQEVFY